MIMGFYAPVDARCSGACGEPFYKLLKMRAPRSSQVGPKPLSLIFLKVAYLPYPFGWKQKTL